MLERKNVLLIFSYIYFFYFSNSRVFIPSAEISFGTPGNQSVKSINLIKLFQTFLAPVIKIKTSQIC